MITERDIQVLLALHRYYLLSRPQIQAVCFPSDNTGRVTRRRLQALVHEGLVNRHRAQFIYPNSSPAGSVYYPAPRGCEVLVEMLGDERYLNSPTRAPQAHHVMHWLAISEYHLLVDRAVERQSALALGDWINEYDIVNADEENPEQRFRLYTLLRTEPRLVCAPDAAFSLTMAGVTKGYYIELDRGTSGARQVAARKHKGYAELASHSHHRNHFPHANVEPFGVLCIAPTIGRVKLLRREMKGKPGEELWRFAAMNELTPENFFTGDVFYSTSGGPFSLVKPEAVGDGS